MKYKESIRRILVSLYFGGFEDGLKNKSKPNKIDSAMTLIEDYIEENCGETE
jgi:hypothetical protein